MPLPSSSVTKHMLPCSVRCPRGMRPRSRRPRRCGRGARSSVAARHAVARTGSSPRRHNTSTGWLPSAKPSSRSSAVGALLLVELGQGRIDDLARRTASANSAPRAAAAVRAPPRCALPRRDLQAPQQLGPRRPERIAGADQDQVLRFVARRPHPLQEVVERTERPAAAARRQDRLHRARRQPVHVGEADADRRRVDSSWSAWPVLHARGLQRCAEPFGLLGVDAGREVAGVVAQQRREERRRPARLQPDAAVGEPAVGDRVRLAERVGGEARHLRPDLLDRRSRQAAPQPRHQERVELVDPLRRVCRAAAATRRRRSHRVPPPPSPRGSRPPGRA
jgi:hypothetical protein